MIDRRDVLIGGACLLAAGGAAAMQPRNRMSLLGKIKLEQAIPERFAGWSKSDASGIVAPASENSLAAQLYSQIVGRLYERADGAYAMLLIAYGDTQNDLLQLHRPEVCYPAFGFQVKNLTPASFDITPGVSIPGRTLTATADDRIEHISYWTRIGEYLPVDDREQRIDKIKTAFAGIVPDGALIRISSQLDDPAESLALNRRFAEDMIRATARPALPALITTANARLLAQA